MMKDKIPTRRFWKAPSGRLHWLRRCSGGSSTNRMTWIDLTHDEFIAFENKCRCAVWKTKS